MPWPKDVLDADQMYATLVWYGDAGDEGQREFDRLWVELPDDLKGWCERSRWRDVFDPHRREAAGLLPLRDLRGASDG